MLDTESSSKVETKQEVKLLYITPLWLISNAIRYSHDNHHLSDTLVAEDISEFDCCPYCNSKLEVYSDEFEYFKYCKVCNAEFDNNIIGKKDYELIKKVGLHLNHSSTLEHSLIAFHLKLTTKALLELSRSRIGVSMTVSSSRYALDTMGIEIEPTGDTTVDALLDDFSHKVNILLENASKKEFDKLAELLPQSFLYKGQFTFNLRSLIHFLELRLSASAHRDIRLLAKMMVDKLPEDYRGLIFENKKIKDSYNKTVKWLEKDNNV